METKALGFFPDRIIEAQGVREGASSVDHTAWGIVRNDAAHVVGLKGEALKLDADLWCQTFGLPCGHSPFERSARAKAEGLAVNIVKVAQNDFGVLIPAVPDFFGFPLQLHVGQPLHHHGAGGIEQILVIMHPEGGAAKPCAAVSDFTAGQVFAPHD